jgi:hypothetical protein
MAFVERIAQAGDTEPDAEVLERQVEVEAVRGG